MQYRKAATGDTDRIMEIIRQAQAQMRALGSEQWQNGYPARQDIERDIALGRGMVAYLDQTDGSPITDPGPCPESVHSASSCVVAYAAVVFDGEPAYSDIQGTWLTDGSYVVVHRLAVADGMKGRGMATAFMRYVEQTALAHNIISFRIDTNFDNHYMQRALSTLGFTYCGKISYEGGERLAYEKILHENN